MEVLQIFGIATKEIRRGSASEFRIGWEWILIELRIEKFLRKLAGMAHLEGALKKLDSLTQEEARMALAEVLKISHNIRDGVKVVDGKVESVGYKVDDMGDKVADIGGRVAGVGNVVEGVSGKVGDMGDKVEDIGDKVQCVDKKVQVVIDGRRGVTSQSPIPSHI